MPLHNEIVPCARIANAYRQFEMDPMLATISRYLAEQTSWQAPKDAKCPLIRATMYDIAHIAHRAHQDSHSHLQLALRFH